MNKSVLFAGPRPYGRAENISALYDFFTGEKQYLGIYNYNEFLKINDNYNVLVIDEFPRRFSKKNILLWHAIQGGKCIGYNQPNPYINPSIINNIDYIIAAGHGAIPMWSDCTGLPENKILPLGMPRTDVFIGKNKGDGHTLLANKRAYLYVPTFREPSEPSYFVLDYDWLDHELTDNELFVIKAHMRGEQMLSKKYKHIIEINSTEPSTPYLYDCDVVITDYSSIIFDGYLLNKPSILFEKQKGYIESRGMYMQYPIEYSSRYATNEEELLSIAREASSLTEVERNCITKVADMCDGHSCERICNLITQLNI